MEHSANLPAAWVASREADGLGALKLVLSGHSTLPATGSLISGNRLNKYSTQWEGGLGEEMVQE